MGDLGKLIVAKDFKTCPKSNKSPNLVTLPVTLLGTLAPFLPPRYKMSSEQELMMMHSSEIDPLDSGGVV